MTSNKQPCKICRCVGKQECEVEGVVKKFEFQELGCSQWPKNIVEKSEETCGPNGEANIVQVKFETASTYYKEVFRTCLDFVTFDSLWSSHTVHKEIAQRAYGGEHPDFASKHYYIFL